jgi:hypothetical protein
MVYYMSQYTSFLHSVFQSPQCVCEIFSSAPSSQIPFSLFSSLNFRDQVFHTYNTAGKIIVLYTSILNFHICSGNSVFTQCQNT